MKKNINDMVKEDLNNELEKALKLLNFFVEDFNEFKKLPEDKRIALLAVAGKLAHPGKEELRKRKQAAKAERKNKKIESDKIARANTGIRAARQQKIFKAPLQLKSPQNSFIQNEAELNSYRNCYICKAEYTKLHHFYDSMCMPCGDFNYKKRFQTANLQGQVVIITGSRLKIGYQATLMLLRAGATVIATTRFPNDSALRYAKEKDYTEWADRLKIYGLDLRHLPSVEIFAEYVEKKFDRLDIIINNAAQTVHRPPAFYAHLMENESRNISALPVEAQKLLLGFNNLKEDLTAICLSEKVDAKNNLPVSWHGKGPGIGIRSSAQLSQIPYSYDNSLNVKEVFPKGELDADLQQVDLRKTNSWRYKLGDIPAIEMLEVQLVNAVAPFVLNNKLVNLMKKENTGQKHIVNVTAMEGKFYRFKKDPRHPHTNMAKAALNMLTHTSAQELEKFGIYTNAVDTGWVTDEDPVDLVKFKENAHDFQPPLDIVDGAARVCDPIFDGINSGKHWSGKFLKDYEPIDW